MQFLKRTSEAHTNPDSIIHQDILVHSTASGDVHCGSKCTSVHHDLEISISDEDETCIPSPAVLPDQRNITSSLAIEVAQCHFHIAQAPASGMGYKHFTQHDIKSHPPDEVGLNSPHSSVHTVSPNPPISCNSIVHPFEEKVLPSPFEFPAQSMTASHPIGVDGDLEDYGC